MRRFCRNLWMCLIIRVRIKSKIIHHLHLPKWLSHNLNQPHNATRLPNSPKTPVNLPLPTSNRTALSNRPAVTSNNNTLNNNQPPLAKSRSIMTSNNLLITASFTVRITSLTNKENRG